MITRQLLQTNPILQAILKDDVLRSDRDLSVIATDQHVYPLVRRHRTVGTGNTDSPLVIIGSAHGNEFLCRHQSGRCCILKAVHCQNPCITHPSPSCNPRTS